jgi:hypothetical protein
MEYWPHELVRFTDDKRLLIVNLFVEFECENTRSARISGTSGIKV